MPNVLPSCRMGCRKLCWSPNHDQQGWPSPRANPIASSHGHYMPPDITKNAFFLGVELSTAFADHPRAGACIENSSKHPG
eukprot:c6992_g1_i1 orf=2-238(-)